VVTKEDGVDEAGRSAKPPLMTASAAEDVDSDAAVDLDADGTDEVDDFSENTPASADDAEDRGTAADYGLGDANAADNDADGAFSWSSSAWSSSSWDSSSDSEGSSAFGDTASGDGTSSFASADSAAGSSYSDSSYLPSPTTRSDVPFPADQIGRTRPDVSPFGAAATGREATRADSGISPSSDAPSSGAPSSGAPSSDAPNSDTASSGDAGSGAASGRDGFFAADRLGAAAAGLGSKLDLNGKLDRGRQAWRQAMTGPNNWLSARTSPSSSSPGTVSPSGTASPAGTASSSPAASRSAFTPARDGGSAAGYTTEYVSGTGSYGESASYGSPAGYAGSAPGSASYGGPAAGTAPAGSTSSAGSAVAAGAAYAGNRPSADSSGSSWRGPATVSASKAGATKAGASKAKRKKSRRQAQLTLSRIEPWSVMKFSFLVSVVAFIVLFVAVALLYMVVSSLGVFTSLQSTVSTLTGSKGTAGTNVASWFSASRILGYTGMLGALNIVLITAISTVGAVVYNLIAQAIGGIEVTLRETE
jgi:hypothetical protein